LIGVKRADDGAVAGQVTVKATIAALEPVFEISAACREVNVVAGSRAS